MASQASREHLDAAPTDAPLAVTNSDEPQILPASLANEPLAEIVVSGCKKFRTLIPYVVELRKRFNSKIRGNADIAGCNTWTEFCEKHLDRTTSAVQRAIAVHTPKPPAPEPPVYDGSGTQIIHLPSLDDFQPEGDASSPLALIPDADFATNVKVGDDIFCVQGKTMPRIFKVGKITDKRIQIEGDTSAGNYGFPKNTLKCWNISALRIATDEDRRIVAEYDASQKLKSERINKHLLGAEIGDQLIINGSAGTRIGVILHIDKNYVTVKLGETDKSIKAFPLNTDCNTIRRNITKEPRLGDELKERETLVIDGKGQSHIENINDSTSSRPLQPSEESKSIPEPTPKPQLAPTYGPANAVEAIMEVMDKLVRHMSSEDIQSVYQKLRDELTTRMVKNLGENHAS